VTIARFSRTKLSPSVYWLTVCLTNKDLAVLKWAQGLFGGRLSEKSRKNERWAVAYTLTLNKKSETKMFLEAVLPYVRIKKMQVEHALAFLSLPPKRCVYERRVGSWPLKVVDSSDLEARELMKVRMNELNMRGPKRLAR